MLLFLGYWCHVYALHKLCRTAADFALLCVFVWGQSWVLWIFRFHNHGDYSLWLMILPKDIKGGPPFIKFTHFKQASDIDEKTFSNIMFWILTKKTFSSIMFWTLKKRHFWVLYFKHWRWDIFMHYVLNIDEKTFLSNILWTLTIRDFQALCFEHWRKVIFECYTLNIDEKTFSSKYFEYWWKDILNHYVLNTNGKALSSFISWNW